jgi:hypothetical protein
MADSTAFETAFDELERSESLDRLAARGTIRLALKTSGLDPKTVSPEELAVVVEQLLPRELEQRGVPDRDTVCKRILGALARLPAEPAAASPESVFARLGGED